MRKSKFKLGESFTNLNLRTKWSKLAFTNLHVSRSQTAVAKDFTFIF